MKRQVVSMTLVAMAMTVSAANAQAPRGAASQTSASGIYVWVDGQYNRLRLPAYQLGLRAIDNATEEDKGLLQASEPRLNGGGVRGAIGRVIPGTTARFEFGGSYVGAKASNTESITTSTFGVVTQFIDGRAGGGYFCSTAFYCTAASALSTDYSAWQFNGKVAADWKFGSVTVTPSAAMFGGNTRADQTLSQTFAMISAATGVANPTGRYSANTSLKWHDVGGRIGLDVNVPVSAALTVAVGAWVGGAGRTTSLSGSDAASDTTGTANGSGVLSIGDRRAVFLANAEAGFAYKVTPMTALRGFAGLNYDGGVPGIAGPSFTGPVSLTTTTTAASISYGRETSYYAGGGLTVSLAP